MAVVQGEGPVADRWEAVDPAVVLAVARWAAGQAEVALADAAVVEA